MVEVTFGAGSDNISPLLAANKGSMA